jgi:hypothetical protein
MPLILITLIPILGTLIVWALLYFKVTKNQDQKNRTKWFIILLVFGVLFITAPFWLAKLVAKIFKPKN